MLDQPIVKIGERLVGDKYPCFIIAEAGINHNGSIETAFRLVDAAVEAKADAVKFQKRVLRNLYPQRLLDDPNSAEWQFQYMLPFLKTTDLTDDEFRQIRAYCDQQHIRFMCTPWDEDSLIFLEEMSIDCYKVASADLVNLSLLEKLVETNKPLILSTGMATLPEIERTVNFLKKKHASFALLHCVSTYPAPFENLNLRFLQVLRKFDVPIGYSGHERGIAIPVVALALGACIIEKHITLDRTSIGPDHSSSLEPAGFGKLVRDIRNAETALGKPEKHLASMEILNRQVLRKSLVAATFLPSGTIVSREMIAIKGPGKGLSPQRLDELIGTRLDREIPQDDYFAEGDLLGEFDQFIMVSKLHHKWGLKARFHDLQSILEKKPQLVELHFSEADVTYPFSPPARPYPQQLFVHAPEFFNGKLLDLCTFDDERREQSIALVQQTIDKAAALAVHFTGPVGIVIHVGGMSIDEPIKDHTTLLERSVGAFKRFDPKGTFLLPENLPPRPWYLGGQWIQNVFIRPEEMVEICQAIGVGMTLDLSHAQLYCNSYDRTLQEFIDLCLPYSRHLHIADANGIDGEGIQIGEGVIEWDIILEKLRDHDFSWVPEIWSGHLHQGAGFITAINRLAKYGIL